MRRTLSSHGACPDQIVGDACNLSRKRAVKGVEKRDRVRHGEPPVEPAAVAAPGVTMVRASSSQRLTQSRGRTRPVRAWPSVFMQGPVQRRGGLDLTRVTQVG